MSKSLIVTTEENPGQTTGSFLVKISQALAQEIDLITAKRRVKVETLINEILEQYVTRQSLSKKPSGAAFLLSLAGKFSSGASDTSQSVCTVVTDFVLKRQPCRTNS